mgnify:FL=1
MADIESEFQIGGLGKRIFLLVFHGVVWLNVEVLIGIKTKLDNADRLPIRQADTPV